MGGINLSKTIGVRVNYPFIKHNYSHISSHIRISEVEAHINNLAVKKVTSPFRDKMNSFTAILLCFLIQVLIFRKIANGDNTIRNIQIYISQSDSIFQVTQIENYYYIYQYNTYFFYSYI